MSASPRLDQTERDMAEALSSLVFWALAYRAGATGTSGIDQTVPRERIRAIPIREGLHAFTLDTLTIKFGPEVYDNVRRQLIEGGVSGEKLAAFQFAISFEAE